MPIPTDTPRPALLSTPTSDDLERALVNQMHGEPNAQCEWQVVEQAQQEIYLWVICQSDDSGVFAPAIVHVGPDGHVQRVDMLRDGMLDNPEAQLLLPPDVRKRILAAELDMSAMLTRLAARRAKFSTPPAPTPSLRIPPPPGLVYVAEPKLWKIGRDGKPAQIFDYFDNLSALSPDGKQVLYISDGLWLADLATGNRRKLVQSAHRPEYPRWWLARPDVIVLGSVPPDFAGAPEGWSPALVRIDGQGFRVLDPKSLSDSVPVPGPDGQTIAYERDGQPWLYRWGKGSEPLNPAHYGLTNTMELGFTRPAWSPDGKRLAWVTESLVDGLPERNGIAIFNLDAKTARLVHPDKPMIALELLPMDVPAWSPDGRWIAVTGFLKGQEQDSWFSGNCRGELMFYARYGH
jgi:Tol biopolymer transport system component